MPPPSPAPGRNSSQVRDDETPFRSRKFTSVRLDRVSEPVPAHLLAVKEAQQQNGVLMTRRKPDKLHLPRTRTGRRYVRTAITHAIYDA